MNGKPRPREVRRAIHHNFDLLTVYTSDEQAERALQALRGAGFTPEEAVILHGEEIRSVELLERTAVIWGLIIAEIAVGTVLGTVIGWITGLYLFPLTPSLSTASLLIGLGCGFVVGLAAGFIEWLRWSNRRAADKPRVLVGIRVEVAKARGNRMTTARKLERVDAARKILEEHGGLAIDSI